MIILKMNEEKNLRMEKRSTTYQGEMNAERIAVFLPREVAGEDLKTCTVTLHASHSEGGDVIPLFLAESFGGYAASASLLRTHTEHPGALDLWIEVLSEGMLAKSDTVTVWVKEHTEVEGEAVASALSSLHEWLRATDALTKTLEERVNETRGAAESARIASECLDAVRAETEKIALTPELVDTAEGMVLALGEVLKRESILIPVAAEDETPAMRVLKVLTEALAPDASLVFSGEMGEFLFCSDRGDYSRKYRKNRKHGVVHGDGNYGYLDLCEQNLRIILLDSEETYGWEHGEEFGNVSDTQLGWLAETLASAPQGGGVILASHRALTEADVTYVEPVGGIQRTAKLSGVRRVLHAFVNRKTVTVGEMEYDFSQTDASLLALIYGAQGEDSILFGYVPSLGAEDLSLMTVNPEALHRVTNGLCESYKLTRYGEYENRLPGYLENTALSNSGAETTRNGVWLSGFVPVAFEDVVYLKNIKMQTGQSNSASQRIYFFDAEKKLISSATVNLSGVDDLLGGVFDENGVLVEFCAKITRNGVVAGENFAYFRITTGGFGEDSIISRNQPLV